jgi:hypothetical protein
MSWQWYPEISRHMCWLTWPFFPHKIHRADLQNGLFIVLAILAFLDIFRFHFFCLSTIFLAIEVKISIHYFDSLVISSNRFLLPCGELT